MARATDGRRSRADLKGVAATAANLVDRLDILQFDLGLLQPLNGDLQQLRALLEETFAHAPDIILQSFCCAGGLTGLAAFASAAIDQRLLSTAVLEPLTAAELHPNPADAQALLREVSERLVPAGPVMTCRHLRELTEAILDGSVAIALAGVPGALAIRIEQWAERAIERSAAEPAVLGSHDAFVEVADTNLSLVRRRLRTPRLHVDRYRMGSISRTTVYLLHLHGIGDDRLVEEFRTRLGRIRVDGVIVQNQLKECIRDAPYSPFPTTQRTERPERVAAALLEGRVALLVDGIPAAIIAPVTLPALMKAVDDYDMHWLAASAVRLTRWLALALGLLTPALYAAITTYHQEFIPTPLLITVTASRENVPLPTLAEVLAVLILFEVVREAGVRVPQGIGNALTIGGTLVVGQAAVRAGLVSGSVIIVGAMVAIAFFALSSYELIQVCRLLLYPLLLAAGILGIYGFFLAVIVLLLHLTSLRSYGVPYLHPIAPVRTADWKDAVVRAPWFRIRTRPVITGYTQPRRVGRPPHTPRPPRRQP